jgi:hypothetical protein
MCYTDASKEFQQIAFTLLTTIINLHTSTASLGVLGWHSGWKDPQRPTQTRQRHTNFIKTRHTARDEGKALNNQLRMPKEHVAQEVQRAPNEWARHFKVKRTFSPLAWSRDDGYVMDRGRCSLIDYWYYVCCWCFGMPPLIQFWCNIKLWLVIRWKRWCWFVCYICCDERCWWL